MMLQLPILTQIYEIFKQYLIIQQNKLPLIISYSEKYKKRVKVQNLVITAYTIHDAFNLSPGSNFELLSSCGKAILENHFSPLPFPHARASKKEIQFASNYTHLEIVRITKGICTIRTRLHAPIHRIESSSWPQTRVIPPGEVKIVSNEEHLYDIWCQPAHGGMCVHAGLSLCDARAVSTILRD